MRGRNQSLRIPPAGRQVHDGTNQSGGLLHMPQAVPETDAVRRRRRRRKVIDFTYRMLITFVPTSGLVYVILQTIAPSQQPPSIAEVVAVGSTVVLVLDRVFAFLGPILRKKVGGGNGALASDLSIPEFEARVRDTMQSVVEPHQRREIELLEKIDDKLERLNTNMTLLLEFDRRNRPRGGD